MHNHKRLALHLDSPNPNPVFSFSLRVSFYLQYFILSLKPLLFCFCYLKPLLFHSPSFSALKSHRYSVYNITPKANTHIHISITHQYTCLRCVFQIEVCTLLTRSAREPVFSTSQYGSVHSE